MGDSPIKPEQTDFAGRMQRRSHSHVVSLQRFAGQLATGRGVEADVLAFRSTPANDRPPKSSPGTDSSVRNHAA